MLNTKRLSLTCQAFWSFTIVQYLLFRIFSGDETGRIIVHDFLAFNEKTEGNQQEDRATVRDHREVSENDTIETTAKEKSDSTVTENNEAPGENKIEATVLDIRAASVEETVKDDGEASINQSEPEHEASTMVQENTH